MKNTKSRLAKIAGALLAIAAMLSLLSSCSMPSFSAVKKEANAILYMKDGGLYYLEHGDKTGQLITPDFIDLDEFEYARYTGDNAIELAAKIEGKTVFYPDKVSEFGYDLCKKNINKLDEPGEKIDANVYMYISDSKGKRIAYCTYDDFWFDMSFSEGGDLFIYEDGKKERISQNAIILDATKKLDKLLYRSVPEEAERESDVFIRYEKNGENKRVFRADGVYAWAEDFSVIWYFYGGTLYKWIEETDEKEKIADNIYKVIDVYEDGSAYYIRKSKEKHKISDFVIDDTEETEDYFVRMRYGEIKEKLDEELELDNPMCELYYYDGNAEEKLTGKFADRNYGYQKEDAVRGFVFEEYNYEKAKKTRLSEYDDIADLTFDISQNLAETKTTHIAVIGEVFDIPQREVEKIIIDANAGRCIYLANAVADENEFYKTGMLYEIKYEKGELKGPKKYDESVSSADVRFIKDGRLVYFKGYNDEKNIADMYVEGDEWDYDVSSAFGMEDNGACIVYYTDYNDTYGGTLNIAKKGEKERIADAIGYHLLLPDGCVYYMTFDSESRRHKLYRYNGKNSVEIDYDVVGIYKLKYSRLKSPLLALS